MGDSQRTRARPRVVIVGAGFGGLEAAKALRREKVDVVVIDKRNHHLFQPLLYQVATAALSATDIAAPIRQVLSRCENCTVLLGEVDRIDRAAKKVHIAGDEALAFDYLVLASGATNRYFGHDEWEAHAPGLKSLEEALDVRRRVLLAFENAERVSGEGASDDVVMAYLTFVVVGGGATGVELAGALTEIARHTMTKDFRNFDPKRARVVLLEGGDRLLPAFVPELSEHVKHDLESLGVEVHLETLAECIDSEGVVLKGGERIAARTVLWAAGVAAERVGRSLGVPVDKAGRVKIERDLTIDDDHAIYVIGDAATMDQDGEPLPGVAQVAIQMGRHAAENITLTIAGEARKEFRYHDKGSMATIGRSRAIAQIGHVRFTGFIAWLVWLFVHVMALVGFRNRVAVLLEWAYAYLTYQRSARIILQD